MIFTGAITSGVLGVPSIPRQVSLLEDLLSCCVLLQ